MICHDQRIDRRILHQAQALQEMGWAGKVVCLSEGAVDSLDHYEGVNLHRVGLSRVINSCPVFWRFHSRHRLINWWGRWTKFLSKLNWKLYKRELRWTYQSKSFYYPLPFDFAFCAAANHYPADLVIAHDLTALTAGAQMAKSWKVPLVYDAHELYYEQAVFSKKHKKLMSQIERRLIHECDAVFTVNQSIADEMAKRYACKTPNVLLNVTDSPEDFDPNFSYTLIRDHLELSEDKTILIFQGGFTKHRNLENLVESMAYVQNPQAVLVMLGFGNMREPLETLVMHKNLKGRVYFIDEVPQSELIYWSASADLGIVPYPPIDLNTLYCTPNKLFEFIQAGLPMIANDSPVVRRFVQETGFGVVGKMDSPQAIARLIDETLYDPQKIAQAKANVILNRQTYSWKSVKSSYVSIIHQASSLLEPLKPNIDHVTEW
jgi:glycosyltransferase involved in cell wall biosynthesis